MNRKKKKNKRTRKISHFAAGVIIALALLELISRWACPYRIEFAGDLALRNPFFRRAWPEYTAARPIPPGKKRLVLVGNSQAFGPELRTESIYPTLLLEKLNQNGNWQVDNWAVPGAIIHDFALLTAKAVAQKADVVLVVTYVGNFTRKEIHSPTLFSAADVPYIGAEPKVASIMGLEYTLGFVGLEDGLKIAVNRASYLFRNGDFFRDSMLHRFGYQGLIRYAPGIPIQETYWWQNSGPEYDIDAFLEEKKRAMQYVPSYDLAEVDLEAIDLFKPILENKGATKIIFVLMPLCRPVMKDSYIRGLDQFNTEIKRQYPRAGIPVWDMTDAVDSHQFLTLSHLQRSGHRTLAEKLFAKIDAQDWGR